MDKKLMEQFQKEKNIHYSLEYHSGGLWADYITWLENKVNELSENKVNEKFKSN